MADDSPYIHEPSIRTPGWGATVIMNGSSEPTPATQSSSKTASSDNSPIQSPVVIGGIAAAGSALIALILWMTWVLCRSKRASQRRRQLHGDDDETGARPKQQQQQQDWATVAEQFNRAKSPHQPALRAQSPLSSSSKPPPTLAQQFAFPHSGKSSPTNAAAAPGGSSSQPSSSSRAKSPQLPLASGRPSPQTQPTSRLAPPSGPIKPGLVGKPQALPHLFSRPLSRDEFRILDQHTQAGNMPQPFAKLQPADVTRIERAVRNSVTQQQFRQQHQDPLNAAMGSTHSRSGSGTRSGSISTSGLRGPPPSTYARKKFSVISTRSKHQSSGATSVASSFSFASMPYRSSSSLGAVKESDDIDDASVSGQVLSSPIVARIQPGFHAAKVSFTPLLPDEVELKAGERVTVVDVYTDGWCIVLRRGEEDMIMGAVPIYCFTDPPPDTPVGFERTRPERKASLGITVELEAGEDATGDNDDDHETDAGRSSRHDSVFSWSNF